MPALQQMFNSVTEMRYSITSIDAMYNDIKNLKSFTNYSKNKDPLQLNNNIVLGILIMIILMLIEQL